MKWGGTSTCVGADIGALCGYPVSIGWMLRATGVGPAPGVGRAGGGVNVVSGVVIR